MSARRILAAHWPEYLIEAFSLGVFMVSACLTVSLFEYPGSTVHQAVANPLLRRGLTGFGMGLTAIALIYSPWGKRSGAHLNPAMTLTFYLLGKISAWDTVFYTLSQCVGGISGVLFARLLLGDAILGSAQVNYILTQPGVYGTSIAFVAEAVISFVLMMAVLVCSNIQRLNAYTGLLAACLIISYITFEAPLSGMSMNPARSLGSAVAARNATVLWLYFTAPLLGMVSAAEIYRHIKGGAGILCCKLHHENSQRCIFHCRYGQAYKG